MRFLRTLFVLLLLFAYKHSICQRIESLAEKNQRNLSFKTYPDTGIIRQAPWKKSENKTIKLPSQKVATSFLDTCATYTFRLKIGTDITNEEISDITTLRDGNMLLTGKTNKNGLQDDALLIKLNSAGTVVWTKTFGENNKEEIFYKARETSDGGIIAIGSAFNTSFTEGFILICKMDGNGNVQWTRKYRQATGTYARGADIIQLLDNRFAFLGDDSKDILYGIISTTGAVVWNQSTRLTDSTRALNIIEDYQGLYIATAGMETGWHVSNLMSVKITDGTLNWRRKFGGAAMNMHYIFQKMQYINIRPRITGVYAAAGQPYQFMRITVNSGGSTEQLEQYSAAGITPDTTSNMVIIPWAEAMAFSPNNNSTAITIFQNIPDATEVSWAFTYTEGTNLQLMALEKTSDAGFIAACNVINNSAHDILLIKVDSAGLSPGCDGAPVAIARNGINPSIPAPPASITGNVLSADNNVIPGNDTQLDSIYFCRQLTCPVFPIEDTCLVTFDKHYRSYQFCEVPTGASMTNDDHLILSGVHRDNPYDASWERTFTIKINNKGDLVAKKRFNIGENCVILRQLRLSDNTTLVAGYFYATTSAYGFFFMKMDNDLNVIWSKTYAVTEPSFNFGGLAEAADGSIFFSLYYYNFATLNDRISLLKFDNTGNLLWEKNHKVSGSVSLFGNSGSLMCIGTDVYLSAAIFYSPEQKWKTFIGKLDQATGTFAWSKRYSNPGQVTIFSPGFQMQGNSLLCRGYIELPSQSATAFIKMDYNGSILNLKAQVDVNTSTQFAVAPAANSDILLSGHLYDYSTSPVGRYLTFVRLDSDFNIKYSKKSVMQGAKDGSAILEDQQGYVYVYGMNNYPTAYNADFSVRKYTPDGTLGTCPSDTFVFQEVPISLTVTDQLMVSATASPVAPVAIAIQEIDFSLQQNALLCGSVSGCDTLWLNGPASICDSSNAVTFYANKNAGCKAPVNWIINSSHVEIQQKTDSLIRIRFLKNDIYTVKAQLMTGCRIFEDSLHITARPSPVLELGPDINICPANTLVVRAKPGFQNYLWQDNSTDSIITINAPGTYYVQVSDSCGNIFSDTVRVTPAPPVPFDLGIDRVKCNRDSLTINSPAGFLNYNWSPNYNIVAVTGQSATVFPYTDTEYTVIAEKTPGCFAYDTIRVTVNHSPPISLGADTSFCNGNTLTLNAGTGFQSYTWSTGAIAQQVQVQTVGQYSIIGTAVNGCKSFDTLKILNVYNNPVVTLTKDPVLCEGSNQVLNPGPGFNGYLWSTGSPEQTITVISTGTYWVQVTDINNCKGSDTSKITKLVKPPSGFLPEDTSLCSYFTLQLKSAAAYSSYLWNNGSVTNSITVSQPGWYWLQVSDNDDCSGRDSILVNPKQCLEGFFIPSAFTPNKDGKNDIFQPLLYGNVAKYKFTIFNRWGEKVFETTSLLKGWDGTVVGKATDSNVFVWQCSFQFAGQPEEFRKGTVVLIR